MLVLDCLGRLLGGRSVLALPSPSRSDLADLAVPGLAHLPSPSTPSHQSYRSHPGSCLPARGALHSNKTRQFQSYSIITQQRVTTAHTLTKPSVVRDLRDFLATSCDQTCKRPPVFSVARPLLAAWSFHETDHSLRVSYESKMNQGYLLSVTIQLSSKKSYPASFLLLLRIAPLYPTLASHASQEAKESKGVESCSNILEPWS